MRPDHSARCPAPATEFGNRGGRAEREVTSRSADPSLAWR
jgi:hypothetical protein